MRHVNKAVLLITPAFTGLLKPEPGNHPHNTIELIVILSIKHTEKPPCQTNGKVVILFVMNSEPNAVTLSKHGYVVLATWRNTLLTESFRSLGIYNFLPLPYPVFNINCPILAS